MVCKDQSSLEEQNNEISIYYKEDLIQWLISYDLTDPAMAVSTLEKLRTQRCLVYEAGHPSSPNAESLEDSWRVAHLQFILEG